MRLSPCSECSRHVKESDASCPFCGAMRTGGGEPSPARRAAGRLSRAALFAAGAAGAAMATADCSSAQPAYGGATFIPAEVGDSSATPESSTTTADASDAAATPEAGTSATDGAGAPDVPMAVAAYGAAIFPDADTTNDDGPSVVALYGGFAPVDGGLR